MNFRRRTIIVIFFHRSKKKGGLSSLTLKKIIYTISLLCTAYKLSAQVGINTTQPTTTLDIKATNETTGRIPGAYSSQDGILVPRVNSIGTTQGVAEGQLIYIFLMESNSFANMSI